jgi:hypothetical protein
MVKKALFLEFNQPGFGFPQIGATPGLQMRAETASATHIGPGRHETSG